jgi:hypothetical protein
VLFEWQQPARSERQDRISQSRRRIADAVALDPVKAEKLKAEETYYTKVVAAGHNSIGLLRAEQQDFGSFRRSLRWRQNGIQTRKGSTSTSVLLLQIESYKEAIPRSKRNSK